MELRFCEPVSVDGDRLVELCVKMGETRAEEMIALSVDNLWRGMETLRAAYEAHQWKDVIEQSGGMSKIAENLGLTLFARVARDVAACADRSDGPALSANICRLHRIADSSINSVWELCDISV
ncbi:hypothetical protein [uncultured Litoreibacter sp.]|uniref:hypothetical protein n=1 Tax=uncultured Litoreibacter sp. TaxID=1392394 RepID=UPI002617A198|nr:hypothetical protein [uncultured Litoreibacter sp.]